LKRGGVGIRDGSTIGVAISALGQRSSNSFATVGAVTVAVTVTSRASDIVTNVVDASRSSRDLGDNSVAINATATASSNGVDRGVAIVAAQLELGRALESAGPIDTGHIGRVCNQRTTSASSGERIAPSDRAISRSVANGDFAATR